MPGPGIVTPLFSINFLICRNWLAFPFVFDLDEALNTRCSCFRGWVLEIAPPRPILACYLLNNLA